MRTTGTESPRFTLPLSLRLRAYGIALGLTLASVPFLHLYLAVDLELPELLVHALDIAVGPAVGLAVTELLVTGWQRRWDWQIAGLPGVAALAALVVGMGCVWVLTAPTDWLPGTGGIRAKHVASGYRDMSVRALPIGLLIFYLAFASTRRAALKRELEAQRELNRALLARETDGGRSPVESHAGIHLRHDGGELHVRPESIVRVQARENYSEFVLGESESARRPLVRMTLVDAAAKLPAALFVQTHRSHLANLRWVREWVRDGRRTALRMANGDEVPVARSRAEAVRATLARFAGSSR